MTQTKYKIGAVVETPKGKIKILDYTPGKRLPDNKRQHSRATIKFIESGWVCNVQTTNIMSGHIEDCRAKTVYGIGYLDTNIKIPMRGTSMIRRAYDLWANMLKRCYGNYKTCYNDCTVDKRWHSFKNFLNSIQALEGYDRWEKNEEHICLDKDIKKPGNKVYSQETCMFVTNHDNVVEALNRRWGKK
jgi:hypothetical protein